MRLGEGEVEDEPSSAGRARSWMPDDQLGALTMSTLSSPSRNRLLLHDVDWRTYTRLLRAFAERPSVRLTYDRGVLEIMSPLHEHESDSYLLGRFVDTLTEELGLPVKAGRSTTFRRRRRRRGLEPDNSYWIANEAQVRGKRRIDLRVDPPPDLAIEVDVTSGSLDRMGIYAALGVPEVWRLDGPTLSFHMLGTGGRYAASPYSKAFPWLAPTDLTGFLGLQGQMDENAIVARFRAWVRQRMSAGITTPPSP
jgi:Uma2 family endonuclease